MQPYYWALPGNSELFQKAGCKPCSSVVQSEEHGWGWKSGARGSSVDTPNLWCESAQGHLLARLVVKSSAKQGSLTGWFVRCLLVFYLNAPTFPECTKLLDLWVPGPVVWNFLSPLLLDKCYSSFESEYCFLMVPPDPQCQPALLLSVPWTPV